MTTWDWHTTWDGPVQYAWLLGIDQGMTTFNWSVQTTWDWLVNDYLNFARLLWSELCTTSIDWPVHDYLELTFWDWPVQDYLGLNCAGLLGSWDWRAQDYLGLTCAWLHTDWAGQGWPWAPRWWSSYWQERERCWPQAQTSQLTPATIRNIKTLNLIEEELMKNEIFHDQKEFFLFVILLLYLV